MIKNTLIEKSLILNCQGYPLPTLCLSHNECLFTFDCLQELQECFESRDVAKLQEVLSKLPREEAAQHLDRCIKSGLWVPNAKDAEGDGEDATNDEQEDDEEKVTENVEKLQVE